MSVRTELARAHDGEPGTEGLRDLLLFYGGCIDQTPESLLALLDHALAVLALDSPAVHTATLDLHSQPHPRPQRLQADRRRVEEGRRRSLTGRPGNAAPRIRAWRQRTGPAVMLLDAGPRRAGCRRAMTLGASGASEHAVGAAGGAPAPGAPAELLAQLRGSERAQRWVAAFEGEWAAALEESRGTFSLAPLYEVVQVWQARLASAPAVEVFLALGKDDSGFVDMAEIRGRRR
ncbi:DUF6247 family protein [Streptomyces sp. NPDC006324]